jgi:hypothetical protein
MYQRERRKPAGVRLKLMGLTLFKRPLPIHLARLESGQRVAEYAFLDA